MNEQACCAHLRVSWRTKDFKLSEEEAARMNVIAENAGSVYPPIRAGSTMTRGWWECDSGCGMRFQPAPDAPRAGGEPC